MNKQNMLLGVVVVGLLGAGGWWMTQSAPAPSAEKPAAVPAAAPEPKIAAPAIPPKAVVEAPTAPVAVPTVNPPETAAPVAKPATDPELKLVVDDLIRTLESQDVNAFVQNYIAPNMMDMARQAASQQLPATATPEMKAQIEQMIQQRIPQMISQISQQMAQDPHTQEGFQKMAAALKLAQNTAPEMNAAGDQATYTLDTSSDKDLPPTVTFVLHDGKWILDVMAMSQRRQGQ